MNRRNFFKVVTGFVAGIFAGSVKGKKFNIEDFGGWNPKDGWSAGIDPNSDWAKQKDLSIADIVKIRDELIATEFQMQIWIWRHPAYIIHEDGNIEPVPYQDFYKTKFS